MGEAAPAGGGAWRGSVPAELTALVGRRELLAEARRLWSEPQVRVITLTGAAGMGKSRVALRLATGLARVVPDGVWWVDLAGVADASRVGEAVLGVLPEGDQSSGPAGDVLVDVLRPRRALLVLDNCDRLSAAVGVLVTRLLRACPGLRVIATSRERLRVEGEHLLEVAGLPLPDRDQPTAAGSDALRLFAALAAAAHPGFAVTTDNLAEVTELVWLLDGSPLQMELAAPLTREMAIADIVAELGRDRFGVLVDGPAEPAHHRSLWDTIEVSYQRSSEDERRAWTRLSVVAGSFTATAVAPDGDLPVEVVPAVLRGLVAQHVLQVDTETGSVTRYRMLGAVRAYGLRRLRRGRALEGDDRVAPVDADATGVGEEARTRDRYVRFFADQAHRYGRDWYGPEELPNLREACYDLTNYRDLLDQLVEGDGQDAEHAARIVIGLTAARVWFSAGSLAEGVRTLRRVDVALAGTGDDPMARTTVLALAIWLAACQGDAVVADELLDRCRTCVTEIAVPAARAAAESGARDEARVTGARATAMFAETVHAVFIRGQLAEAEETMAGIRAGIAAAQPGLVPTLDLCRSLACAFIAPEDLAREVTQWHLRDALDRGATRASSWARWAEALVELRFGDRRTARSLFRGALRTQGEIGDRWGVLWALEGLAWTASTAGDHRGAARLLGAAGTLRRDLGVTGEGFAAWAAGHVRCVEAVRAALGEPAYRQAYGVGAALTGDAVLALALGDRPPSEAPSPARPVSGLTPRQEDVARLVADGLSDPEIASALVLSKRTVEHHVAAILRRLGLDNRTQLALWWSGQQRPSRMP